MSGRFDTLIAIDLPDPHKSGWRVRWLRDTQTWFGIDARNWEGDGNPRPPRQEDIEAAESVIDELSRFACPRCGLAELGQHAIVADVLGRPSTVCLQVPDPLVVHSAGQGGRRKHDASTNCHRIEGGATWYQDAIYARGKPLTMWQALQRTWCPTCVSHAKRTQEAIRRELTKTLGRPPHDDEVRAIERYRRWEFLAQKLAEVAADYLERRSEGWPEAQSAETSETRSGAGASIRELVARHFGEDT